MFFHMAELLQLIWSALSRLFRSRASQEAEIAALRHQLNVLHRQSPKRPTFSALDRLIVVVLFRIAPGMTNVLKIVGTGGRLADGKPFSRGALYLLLQNRIYRGEITHKDAAYPGQHDAIIDVELTTEFIYSRESPGKIGFTKTAP
ncbi:hypothetical protein IYW41_18985 [Methylocystis sp. H15]|jgi:hypothetical protein|uniref:hypothetical protein n=1 Tax=unclassified Methylocystis TaxID=2625913 RepID=UPI0018C26A2F|nr:MULTISPECIES: hypothetical protein [unclassified Methylocystis]MBG0807679.1 hypothetical protein [Methylocystis sp. H15]